jgi:hypothetical protein
MSRSKQTDPARIRAPRRVRAPHEPRGHGDPSVLHAFARACKELGVPLDPPTGAPAADAPAPLPRLRVACPRLGCHHPAGRREIVRLLRFFGEPCTYGLQAIELRQGESGPPGAGLQLGRLVVPGRIVLYDQLPSPWLLAGRLPEAEAARLRKAGAGVEIAAGGRQTTVTWPAGTLRDFMLFDVLMHEIGHHLIQQYTGKRTARVVRTRDHEAFALQFAHRCRLLYVESQQQTSAGEKDSEAPRRRGSCALAAERTAAGAGPRGGHGGEGDDKVVHRESAKEAKGRKENH